MLLLPALMLSSDAHKQSCSAAVLGLIVLLSPDKVSQCKAAAKLKVSGAAEVFTKGDNVHPNQGQINPQRLCWCQANITDARLITDDWLELVSAC